MALQVALKEALWNSLANYAYVVHDPKTGRTAAIDTPEVEPIEELLREKGWKLDKILNTHWHHDHTGGNKELKDKYGSEIVACEMQAEKINPDHKVKDGDVIEVGSKKAEVIHTPGHTLGHICFHFWEEGIAFVGDCLFSVGCGRVFEGEMSQMLESMDKLKEKLPDSTKVYPAHEYTRKNCEFAMTVEPNNDDLKKRYEEAKQQREAGKPTLPCLMENEKKTNPFLRSDSQDLQREMGMQGKDRVTIFAETRKRKDNF